jgi:hypothetical protein
VETAIASLIVMTMLIFGMLTTSHNHLSAQDEVLQSWREMEEQLGERARTDISPTGAATDGNTVTLTLENEGDTKLADFDQWDVILQYHGIDAQEHIEWCGYGVGGGCRWMKVISEDLEPGILNPDEELVVTIWPTVEITPTGQAIVATPNGICASKAFAR